MQLIGRGDPVGRWDSAVDGLTRLLGWATGRRMLHLPVARAVRDPTVCVLPLWQPTLVVGRSDARADAVTSEEVMEHAAVAWLVEPVSRLGCGC